MAKKPKGPTGMRKGLTAYGDPGFSLFLRKAFIKAAGFSDDALDRPIVAITDTYSDYNPCHGNVRTLVEAVKRGVMLSGGLPFAFPTVSIHESFSNPTSMFLRNLMAIDTEEMIRAQPMDAVVMIGGCDKTVPAQLMGAASANVPAIQLITGPMLVGHYKGEILGACTDCRRLWAMHRAGKIDEAEIEAVSGRLAPTVGTCMVMGTASTMGCLTEALGMALPHTGTIPATHADRVRAAEASGREAVKLAKSGLKPTDVITQGSLRNAMVVLQAIGGSTNAVVHMAALAGRLGLKWDLEELDRIGRDVPVLLDLKPAGSNYMEHFHWSGGVPKLLKELRGHLDLDAPTVTGERIGDWAERAEEVPNQTIIRPLAQPLKKTGAHAVLRGSLAPGGAVIKAAAATPKLMVHTGRAVVFEDVEDMTNRIDDPNLDVTADDILVMRNAGPKGHPGMPEAGLLPIPKKLATQGVTDMIRISDARMSGTAYGTIVLHVTPEAAEGSPLALVRSGDRITLDVPNRRVDLLVSDEELAARRKAWKKPAHMRKRQRGYRKLYLDHVTQADKGCDFDFLEK
ncbi:MAG: dihydroxy-acid dehydratase [Phreatobacter sp.]|uniref:IlvD/Edd family dehydratase n=1 Tax=Phreatobacter sp. TaxID=1966341 RepID=UPI001A54004D|nr:IlvD/Edd family dehydratase [Phreatobacter sp.]MBL8568278.1 dihydroxy-acid dehydratase [Phreatobacter sp.]